MENFNEKALACSGAILAGISMLVLGIGWNVGFYVTAAEQMAKWHMFFDKSILGIITGMVEAAVITFITLYIFGYFYNKLNK